MRKKKALFPFFFVLALVRISWWLYSFFSVVIFSLGVIFFFMFLRVPAEKKALQAT